MARRVSVRRQYIVQLGLVALDHRHVKLVGLDAFNQVALPPSNGVPTEKGFGVELL